LRLLGPTIDDGYELINRDADRSGKNKTTRDSFGEMVGRESVRREAPLYDTAVLRNLCANSATGEDVWWRPTSRNGPPVTSESSANHLASRARWSRFRPNGAINVNKRSGRAQSAPSPYTSDEKQGTIQMARITHVHNRGIAADDPGTAAAATPTAADLFNDATTRMVGGIGPDQVDKIVADLTAVQQMLTAADPQINNLSDLHTRIIINQLNEEIASVQGTTSATGTPILGTDLGQFVGRSINDIHRDIIDIAQGDAGVQALFNPTPLPDVIGSPAPFHDNAEQTAFLTQFIQDSNQLGQTATAIAKHGFHGDVAGLVQQIQTFAADASAFDQSQGGLYSARFWNELREDGTAGTAANALIEGLQTHNAKEVRAAADQLASNASDLASNSIKADGGTYDDVVAAAQPPAHGHHEGAGAGADADATGGAAAAATPTATDLFNDATTRMVGGIGPDQVDKIVADLTAVQQMLSTADPQINNLSDLHTHIIINQLNEEIASVQGTTSATGTPILGTDLGQFVGRSINDIHRDIIDIAQGDAGVQALFNPTPLPDVIGSPAPFQDNAEQTAFLTQFIQDSSHLGQTATAIANEGFQDDVTGLLQQIETYATNASAFDQSQGGLYSARFWNELRSDGTAGTAADALIEGLQTHNAGEVSAAAEQLATNASDLASNNIKVDGGTYDGVVAAAQPSAVTATASSTPAPTSTSAPAVTSTLPPQSTAPAAIADADAGHQAPIDPIGLHDQHSPAADMAHQFHHMWG
jgi:hypothetical protein